MATYKVLQDIEAEDKLLGPLSLRQFIYAVIVVGTCFVMFKLFAVQPLLPLPLLPIVVLFGFLAAPLGHDQSSEIWLLAKIRFSLKPRRRIWDQDGLQELVSVTAPKKTEQILTNGLDQDQAKSRLQALAQTIDSRGWAIKGVGTNLYANPIGGQDGGDQRLLTPTFSAPVDDTNTDDDILDTQNNPLARQMEQMVQASDQSHRQALLNKMNQLRNAAPVAAPPTPDPVLPVAPPATAAYGNTPVLQPDSPTAAPAAAPSAPPQKAAQTTVTPPAKPAIISLASNDDLSVATIARQADKAADNGEVVISLR